jgi:hypothetical protein
MSYCPKCNSERLVNGKITSARDGTVVVFSPAGQRFFSLSMFGGVQFADNGAFACLDCGLVAASVSALELRDFVQKHCSHNSNETAS